MRLVRRRSAFRPESRPHGEAYTMRQHERYIRVLSSRTSKKALLRHKNHNVGAGARGRRTTGGKWCKGGKALERRSARRGGKRMGEAAPVAEGDAAAGTIGQRGCLRGITESSGKREAAPPCGERENRVRCGSADRKKEGRRQRKQESGQAVRLRRWERKRSKARRGEGARGRRNGAPGREEKQGAERGTRARLRRRGGKVGGEARHKGPNEGENEAGRRKRQERAAGREARRPSLPAPPCRNQRHAPAAPRATGVSASGKKNTGAEARFCLREPRRSHRHFTTCRFPKSSGRHSQRVRSRTPSRTPHYPCGPSSLCLRCFGERTTSPF